MPVEAGVLPPLAPDCGVPARLGRPGKALRVTEGGVGWVGVPAYIGLLLMAPADRPLQGRGAEWEQSRRVGREWPTAARSAPCTQASQQENRYPRRRTWAPGSG